MSFSRKTTSLVLTALILAFSCMACLDTDPIEESKGLTSLRVTVVSETGSPQQRLEAGNSINVDLKIEALDEQGNPVSDYRGRLKLSSNAAFLGRNGWDEIEAGHGDTIRTTVARGIGDMRILVEDMDLFVVGASDPIYLPLPTLEVIQRPAGAVDGSPWRENFVHVDTGRIIVTHASIEGFYATDLQGSEYNHIYVYTHNVPAVDRGDILNWVSGTLSEFYGLTEMSFPDYDIACGYYPLPDPVILSRDMLFDEATMEKLESGLVEIQNVKVSFIDYDTYFEYGQWTGSTGDGGQITLITRDVLPEFDPFTFRNQSLERVVGNLRQHYSADPEWILAPRDECDIYGFGQRPEYCDKPMPDTTCVFDGDRTK